MMKVQKYLSEHGLEKLQEEFSIMVTDYPDRVVLNYNQIDSPRFHPICCECRALILCKTDWSVMARSFDRFFNVGEGETWSNFDISHARIYEKLDGSLISLYWDGAEWCSATRKMAFGEGQTYSGQTFAELFNMAKGLTTLDSALEGCQMKAYTWVFELTGPFNRVVKPYAATSLTLLGARHNQSGWELIDEELAHAADEMNVARPKVYEASSFEEVVELAESLPTMDEGFVMVCENSTGSHSRLKCKNSKHVAIAHMRENGGVPTAKNILHLVMANEQHEYLCHFPEDQKVFDLVEKVYAEVIRETEELWEEAKGIEDQKEFAMTIMPRVKRKFESGILFSIRKNGTTVPEELSKIGAKKLAKMLSLKEQVMKTLGVTLEEDA